MGWSCSALAAKTVELIAERSLSLGFDGSNMVSEDAFFEIDKKEHPDGRITGRVFSMDGRDLGEGSISADGSISSMPGMDVAAFSEFCKKRKAGPRR